MVQYEGLNLPLMMTASLAGHWQCLSISSGDDPGGPFNYGRVLVIVAEIAGSRCVFVSARYGSWSGQEWRVGMGLGWVGEVGDVAAKARRARNIRDWLVITKSRSAGHCYSVPGVLGRPGLCKGSEPPCVRKSARMRGTRFRGVTWSLVLVSSDSPCLRLQHFM